MAELVVGQHGLTKRDCKSNHGLSRNVLVLRRIYRYSCKHLGSCAFTVLYSIEVLKCVVSPYTEVTTTLARKMVNTVTKNYVTVDEAK